MKFFINQILNFFVKEIGFDWTSVELKLSSCDIYPNIAKRFDWTSVELKRNLWGDVIRVKIVLIEPVWNWKKIIFPDVFSLTTRFDWTSVELKHKCINKISKCRIVLIEPVWNWNLMIWTICICGCLFWLNQCGIETYKVFAR